MKISIITPSLNQGKFIDDNIISVLQQPYQNYEHLIIDGGSTDNTISILRKYRHLYWISERDSGQSEAFNKGFNTCSGDIIGWLNSDDLYDNDAFSSVVNVFKNNSSAICVVGHCKVIDAEGHIIKELKSKHCDNKIWLNKGYSLIAQPSFFFLRRAILNEQYVLNPKLHYSMDYELILRLQKIGEFYYLDQNLSFFRHHNESKTKTSIIKMRMESYRVALDMGGNRCLLLAKIALLTLYQRFSAKFLTI